ncbi:MAG: hypothetical protein V3S09_00560 [Candidatus Bathyarchaeia archaeon]
MAEKSSKEAELLFEMVRNRYEDRLSAKELEEVRKGVDGIVEAAESLRSVKLGNGTEPFSIFKPYRKGD